MIISQSARNTEIIMNIDIYGIGHRPGAFRPAVRLRCMGLAWLLAIVWVAVPAGAKAQGKAPPARGFQPYAQAGIVYDSNLLRLSSDEKDRLDGDASDYYATVEAGVDGKLEVSRQKIVIDGRIFHNKYDHFDDLDYTGGHGRLAWEWQWNPRWSGDVGYVYDRRLRDFSNQIGAIPRKDLRTENRGFASLTRTLGSGFALELGASAADVQFDETSSLDIDRRTLSAGLFYETLRDTLIGIEAEYLDGDFKDGDARDYEESRAHATLDWQMTKRSRLDARAGFTKRDYSNSERPDFDGFTGEARLVNRGPGRSKWALSLWRKISSLGDEVANYAIIDGISIEPEWGLGRSSALRILLAYEKRDFKGLRSIDVADLELESRDDDIYTAGIWYDLGIAEFFTLSLGYTAEKRDSTRDTAEYDFNRLELRIRVGR